jgi:uncharacterized protein (TIGR03435 family)
VSKSLLILAVSGFAWAQAPTPAPAALAFEVATIKPARPITEQAMSGKMHIGEKIDGARVDYGAMTLADLITVAYKVKSFQVSGPDWLKTERFDILAKLPEGATKDQVPQMLQALLADRFKLVIHRDTKEHAMYALVVAKGGPKLKESPPDDPAPAADAPPPKEEKGVTTLETGQGKLSVKQDGAGGATIKGPNGMQQRVSVSNGIIHMELNKATMEQMCEAITRFLDKPVTDMTELKGNYQIALDISMEDAMKMARSAGVMVPPGGPGGDAKPSEGASDPGGSTIFSSVQQMGLKLESRKAPVEMIVVDHAEKSPTEN